MPSLRDMITAKSKVAGGKPPVTKGLRLSDAEPVKAPGKVRAAGPINDLLTEPSPATGRQLDQTTADGQQVPMDWPCETSSLEEKLWWQARHCLDRHLGVWIEQTAEGAERAWLAVEPPSGGPLILIMPLQLLSNRGPGDPF